MFARFPVVDEGGYPADGLSAVVDQYPARTAAVREEGIAAGIEYCIDVTVERAYPGAIAPVQSPGQIEEFLGSQTIGYFEESHITIFLRR
ncbi:hypothetical protein ACQ86N_43665 [Puia sp. P3]|uniref:hypothetical protein n=1 Tax=Puia sp. P3 TaxID=3423952 RepID=UPI003D66BEDE